jgi:PPOX class probable F420-dependent enzyme
MEKIMIDLDTPFGVRSAKRLADEEIIWLTTTDNQGSPQPRPVWFLWNGESILIFSQPNAYKVAHIENQPRVALNFNSDESGENITVFLGDAQIDKTPVPENEMSEYLKKYHQGLIQINMTEDEFNNSYNLAIRITPTKLRGH